MAHLEGLSRKLSSSAVLRQLPHVVGYIDACRLVVKRTTSQSEQSCLLSCQDPKES